MSVAILVEIISKSFFFPSTQNRDTTMQKSLSCEKSYPTHISTVTELRQCADSTFQSFPEHSTLRLLLFTIPAGLELGTKQSMLLPAAVCVVRTVPSCAQLVGSEPHPHLWEAGCNTPLQTGKLRHRVFLSDFVPNHAVSKLVS